LVSRGRIPAPPGPDNPGGLWEPPLQRPFVPVAVAVAEGEHASAREAGGPLQVRVGVAHDAADEVVKSASSSRMRARYARCVPRALQRRL